MQIMLSIYLNSSTCKYLSLDNGVTMTSKRRENINPVSFICLSFVVIERTQLKAAHAQLFEKLRPIAFAETCRFLTIQSLDFQETWQKIVQKSRE